MQTGARRQLDRRLPLSIPPDIMQALLIGSELLLSGPVVVQTRGQTGAQTGTQTKDEVTHLGTQPFEADLPAGSRLEMHLRSGEIHIIGRDQNKISIRAEGISADRTKEVKVKLRRSNKTAELNISGGPRNNFELTVQVPKTADLLVRMPAGVLEVRGVIGSKDVELHFGELTIAVGSPDEYAHLDASVMSGELDADPFGVSKGGLFRSFKRQGNGSYRLHAHVGAGQLTLR